MPGRLGSIIGGAHESARFKHPGKHYADRMPARIAAGLSERANLLEANAVEAGFLGELSSSRVFERFVLIDKSSRKSPLPLEWFARSPDQQHFNLILGAVQQNKVHGHGRARM